MEEASKPIQRLRRVFSFGRTMGAAQRRRAVEAATANAETLAANRFTAADIVVGYAPGSPTGLGLGPISGPTSQPIGGGCSNAAATKGALAAEESEAERQKIAAGVFRTEPVGSLVRRI
jgi:hypothetical protein